MVVDNSVDALEKTVEIERADAEMRWFVFSEEWTGACARPIFFLGSAYDA